MAKLIDVEEKSLVFVQNAAGDSFTVYQDGKEVRGIRSIRIDAGAEEFTTHEIEYVTGATGQKEDMYVIGVDFARIHPDTPSANERRKEVIEKAKKFVKVESDDGYHYYLLRPRFIINEEKRTVVCLLERYDHGYIHRKGIAKCAPSDVFNVHIGKAIALGRAYGLDVSEFEQAPQPDEVVVGMNTTNRLNVESVYKVTEVSTTEVWRENGLYLEHRDVIILSDTEAQY